MTFEPAAHLLAFVPPLSFQKGDVTFCPTTHVSYVWVAVTPDTIARHVISTAPLTQGPWVARLQWSDGQQYYQEKELFVM